MRTTLTLDPDVAKRLKDLMAGEGITLKRAVNDVLRAGFAHSRRKKPVRFVVEPHSCRFKPGIDLDRLNQLADDLETESYRTSSAQ